MAISNLEMRERDFARQNNKCRRWGRYVSAYSAEGYALLTGSHPEGTTFTQHLDALQRKVEEAYDHWLHNTPIPKGEHRA